MISANFVLNQNYPNPFNASTVISYCLPERQSVTISIYNIKSDLVLETQSEIQENGTHYFTWNGKNAEGQIVPGGIYL